MQPPSSLSASPGCTRPWPANPFPEVTHSLPPLAWHCDSRLFLGAFRVFLCVKFSCWSESQPCGSRIGLSSLSVLAHKIASAFLFRSRRNEAGRQTTAAAPNEYMYLHRLYWPHVITDLGAVDGVLLSCLVPVGGSNASYSFTTYTPVLTVSSRLLIDMSTPKGPIEPHTSISQEQV